MHSKVWLTDSCRHWRTSHCRYQISRSSRPTVISNPNYICAGNDVIQVSPKMVYTMQHYLIKWKSPCYFCITQEQTVLETWWKIKKNILFSISLSPVVFSVSWPRTCYKHKNNPTVIVVSLLFPVNTELYFERTLYVCIQWKLTVKKRSKQCTNSNTEHGEKIKW